MKTSEPQKVDDRYIKESLEDYDQNCHRLNKQDTSFLTEVINGGVYHIIDKPISEFMKSKGAVNMNDIEWT